jgi:hypothetical protein
MSSAPKWNFVIPASSVVPKLKLHRSVDSIGVTKILQAYAGCGISFAFTTE